MLERRPEVVKIGDFLHAEPTELRSTHSAGHVVARSIIHFDDESTAAWTWLDFVCPVNISIIQTYSQ